MKKNPLFFVVLTLNFLVQIESTHAKDILFGKSTQTVAIPFGSETIFRFPSPVKTVTQAYRFEIVPADPNDPDYSVLLVKPRMSQGSADVTFLLGDGSSIRTQLVISAKSIAKPQDSIYDFKPTDELKSTNVFDQKEPVTVTELDLMRAMIGGDQLSGFKPRIVSMDIETGNKDLTLRLIKIYGSVSHGFRGLVYELKTPLKDRKIEVNLPSLAFGQPNLAIMAQSDRASIGGEQESDRIVLLRVVVKPGASARNIFLPKSLDQKASPS